MSSCACNCTQLCVSGDLRRLQVGSSRSEAVDGRVEAGAWSPAANQVTTPRAARQPPPTRLPVLHTNDCCDLTKTCCCCKAKLAGLPLLRSHPRAARDARRYF